MWLTVRTIFTTCETYNFLVRLVRDTTDADAPSFAGVDHVSWGYEYESTSSTPRTTTRILEKDISSRHLPLLFLIINTFPTQDGKHPASLLGSNWACYGMVVATTPIREMLSMAERTPSSHQLWQMFPATPTCRCVRSLKAGASQSDTASLLSASFSSWPLAIKLENSQTASSDA